MANIPSTIGNYILERELGRGGAAVVYLARHRYLKRRLAVKVLLNQDDEAVARFTREAELTSLLHHTSIVQIYDHGTFGPYYYTVMEHVPDGSLRQLLHAIQKGEAEDLGLNDVFWIFRRIGEALDYAHAQGIIHRDVTPGNILLDWGRKRALLTDFGIARLPEGDGRGITSTRIIMGTPGFYSPEHLRSATAVTSQSDLFSLGVVLYAMLAGRLPWEEPPSSPDAMFERPAPLHSFRDVHPSVDQVVQSLLAEKPENRYQRASAAVAALARIYPNLESLRDLGDMGGSETSLYITPAFQASGIGETQVELELGPNLVQDVIERAHRRALELSRPSTLVRLLDSWSAESRWRRKHLGRLATFHRVESTNVYFFSLDVLYETREEPELVEIPDREGLQIDFVDELAPAQVELPQAGGFIEEEGVVDIPGSEQVMDCRMCNGQRQLRCRTCGGQARIVRAVERQVVPDAASSSRSYDDRGGASSRGYDDRELEGHILDNRGFDQRRTGAGSATSTSTALMTTTTEMVEQACPDCNGRGRIKCPDCDGVGRLLRHKTMRWFRRPDRTTANTDVPEVDEKSLSAQAREIYTLESNLIRPEWRRVPVLRELVRAAEAQTDPKTRVVLSSVTVHVVPITRIEFEVGRREFVVDKPLSVEPSERTEGEAPLARVTREEPAAEGGGLLYRLHLLGFGNEISEREAQQFRDWERITLYGVLVFLALVTVIMLFFIIVVYH